MQPGSPDLQCSDAAHASAEVGRASEPDPEQRFLQEFRRFQGQAEGADSASDSSLDAWYRAADALAMREQGALIRAQRRALTLTLLSIAALAGGAVATGSPAPQALCPVAVFLMIRYFDQLRADSRVFRFAASRLLAETLRVILAVQGQSALLRYVLKQRHRHCHAVAALSALACTACSARIDRGLQSAPAGDADWCQWVLDQASYFSHASAREQQRGRNGKLIFNAAFLAVAVLAICAAAGPTLQPAMAGWPSRLLLALAAAVGSMGLAYISFVRERKAFDQSLDYAHMNRLFQGQLCEPFSTASSQLQLVAQALDEHGRWAVRMAGQFTEQPE